MPIRQGTAGWAIPRQYAAAFGAEGSSLERYAARLPVVEINSSFYRPHRISTWERWRDSVPPAFRFSVKLPRTITHQAQLSDCALLLDQFLPQAHALGDKLGVLLVQLPPRLAFDLIRTRTFLAELKARSSTRIAVEPRNASWFTNEANALLEDHEVARVAADPSICNAASEPGGWRGLTYWRLHGSPRLYWSSYQDQIEDLKARMLRYAERNSDAWCIFDNTASGAAMGDALALEDTLTERN